MVKKCEVDDLKRLELFNNISTLSLHRLSSFGYIKSLKKNEYLFRDKDEVKCIYILASGKMALYKLSESAQKKVIFILGKNDIINAVIIDDLPASINCQCFEKAEILSFEKNKFMDVMKDDFELTKIVIKSLSIKVRRLYRQSKNSISIKIEKKLAAKLCKLAKDHGVQVEEGTLININLTITYIGEMLGTPRETISRAMKVLESNNLIINKNKKIIIPSRGKLAAFFKENKL